MYGAPLFNGIGAEGSAGDPPVGKLPQSPDETSLLKTYGWKCAPHDDGSTQRGHGLFQGKALLGADLWRRVTAGKWWAKWACFYRFDVHPGSGLGSRGNSLHSLAPFLHYTVLPDSIIHEEGHVLTRSSQLSDGTLLYSSVLYCKGRSRSVNLLK